MNARGLDRVVIFARSMDDALGLFSGLFGIAFEELSSDDDDDGCRVAFSADRRIELIALAATPEHAAPHVRRWAATLGDADLAVVALCLRVDDAGLAAGELRRAAVTVEADLAFADLKPLSMYGVRELVLAARDTLSLPVCLVEYRDSPDGIGARAPDDGDRQ
jgi:hypothetical protein